MEIYAEPYVKHEIEHFVKRRLGKSQNVTRSGIELFKHYRIWCREYNTLPKSRSEFYKVLGKYFVQKNNNGINFEGVRLRP